MNREVPSLMRQLDTLGWGVLCWDDLGEVISLNAATLMEAWVVASEVNLYARRGGPDEPWSDCVLEGAEVPVSELAEVAKVLIERDMLPMTNNGEVDYFRLHPALRGLVPPTFGTLDANRYQKMALRTEHTPDLFKAGVLGPDRARLLHGMVGIATEAGELLDAFKREAFYGKNLDETNIVEEAGDILWYLALVLDSVDSTLHEAMQRNIQKLWRRYPDAYSPEKALERDLAAERESLEIK